MVSVKCNYLRRQTPSGLHKVTVIFTSVICPVRISPQKTYCLFWFKTQLQSLPNRHFGICISSWWTFQPHKFLTKKYTWKVVPAPRLQLVFYEIDFLVGADRILLKSAKRNWNKNVDRKLRQFLERRACSFCICFLANDRYLAFNFNSLPFEAMIAHYLSNAQFYFSMCGSFKSSWRLTICFHVISFSKNQRFFNRSIRISEKWVFTKPKCTSRANGIHFHLI